MEYFIYLSIEGRSVPHLEPIFADTPEDATACAVRLLASHPFAVSAEIFTDTGLIRVVTADPEQDRT